MEQDMRDMPVHIVNGFQFNEASAQLMSYALDMARLGATIDEDFWETRIFEDDAEFDVTGLFTTSGPLIHRRDFDMFETVERCRKNAAVLFEGLMYGFDRLMGELRSALDLDKGFPSQRDVNKFSAELIQYLTRSAEDSDLLLLERTRAQAASRYDAEPMLLALRVKDNTQYVWNGEWRATCNAERDVRRMQYASWYFNHALTIHRLRSLTSAYLYNKFPEHFGVSREKD